MQRNFEPLRKQVEAWQRSEWTDVTAKVVIYEAFVEGRLEAPTLPGLFMTFVLACGRLIRPALPTNNPCFGVGYAARILSLQSRTRSEMALKQ
jgi:hypothetical protein